MWESGKIILLMPILPTYFQNGGRILFATDDWFAAAENLLLDTPAIFQADVYTDCGKWMDGWETRRKRCPGHDWCLIKLAVPGVVYGVEVDTAFFTGNYAPKVSVQAARLTEQDEALIPFRQENEIGVACTTEMLDQIGKINSDNWIHLIGQTDLKPGYQESRLNYFEVTSRETFTHLRLNMFPDGGIARFRVYGEVFLEKQPNQREIIDLVAFDNGGVCKGYSNAHYGHPRNLIRKGKGINMGDGWETARRLDRPAILELDKNGILQVPGDEWAVFRLGYVGDIESIEVDTNHYKGNFPDSVRLEGARVPVRNHWDDQAIKEVKWKTILSQTKLSAHKAHTFLKDDLSNTGPFSHVKITIAPDGGISRLRIQGRPIENVKLIPIGF